MRVGYSYGVGPVCALILCGAAWSARAEGGLPEGPPPGPCVQVVLNSPGAVSFKAFLTSFSDGQLRLLMLDRREKREYRAEDLALLKFLPPLGPARPGEGRPPDRVPPPPNGTESPEAPGMKPPGPPPPPIFEPDKLPPLEPGEEGLKHEKGHKKWNEGGGEKGDPDRPPPRPFMREVKEKADRMARSKLTDAEYERFMALLKKTVTTFMTPEEQEEMKKFREKIGLPEPGRYRRSAMEARKAHQEQRLEEYIQQKRAALKKDLPEEESRQTVADLFFAYLAQQLPPQEVLAALQSDLRAILDPDLRQRRLGEVRAMADDPVAYGMELPRLEKGPQPMPRPKLKGEK